MLQHFYRCRLFYHKVLSNLGRLYIQFTGYTLYFKAFTLPYIQSVEFVPFRRSKTLRALRSSPSSVFSNLSNLNFVFLSLSKRSWKVATWMQCQKERMSYGRTSKMPWSNDQYCWAATIPAGKSFAIVVRLKVNINVMIATRTTFHELILSLNETRQGKTSQ